MSQHPNSPGFTPLETPSTDVSESSNVPRVSVRKSLTGFTLLEILLVVGIIAILAGIVIVAINPSRQLATVRNTERKSDLKQIYNAITQYYIDHNAYPASSTPAVLTEICDTGTTTYPSSVSCGSLIDLSPLVPTYLVAIPKDPQGSIFSLVPQALAVTNGTGYWIMRDPTNKIVLSAPQAELNISVAIGTTTVATNNSTTTGQVVGGCTATGGTITTSGNYKIHTFTNIGSDTFTVISGNCDAEVLVVAGGGGGGVSDGASGPGGGGGVVHVSSYPLTEQAYAVTVGNGGVARSGWGQGNNGGDSVFGSLTAIGGGGGCGGTDPGQTGKDGGSGGGGCYGYGAGGASTQTTTNGGFANSGFGYRGGTGYAQSGAHGTGGGGGAGGVGADGTGSSGGNGGIGKGYSISGSQVYYGGGGGGGVLTSGYTWGTGGLDGGGGGADGVAGTNGLGGGGGGSRQGGTGGVGGAGGSGVVIIKYAM